MTTLYRPTHLSASKLDTYTRCPQLYYRRYVALVPEPPSVALSFGNAVHAGLEAAYRGEDGQVAFLRDWSNKRAGLTSLGLAVDDTLVARGLRLIDATLALGLSGEPDPRVEVRLAELPVPIVGYVDLWVPDENLIIDFKTSQRSWSARKLAGQLWQPAIYTQAFLARTGVLPRFEFVVLPKDGRPIQRLDASRSVGDLVRTFEAVRQVYAQIAAGAWACTCGDHREIEA